MTNQSTKEITTNLLRVQKHLNSEILKFSVRGELPRDDTNLLRKQLDKVTQHLMTLHLISPLVGSSCPICKRPTPQRISLDEKDDLQIDYPCIYNDCKEVGDE